jgi:hypothetical protein
MESRSCMWTLCELNWIRVTMDIDNNTLEKKMATIQDDIWTILHEIAKGQKELQIAQKETKGQIDSLFLSQKETDNQMKSTNETLKSIGIQLGNMSRNQGDVAEEFFFNSLANDTHLGTIHFDDIAKNEHKRRGKTEEEYDIVMTNGNAIGIVEVKYSNTKHTKTT